MALLHILKSISSSFLLSLGNLIIQFNNHNNHNNHNHNNNNNNNNNNN